MTEKRWLWLILGLFVLLATIYALKTPAFEASDELWHYPMVHHLADGKPLPVQAMDPVLAGPWKQEASQPPLYYYLGAALTFWIDTSDMPAVRRENPHVDNGLITPDGNINLVLHEPEASRWQGTLLAVRIVRLFSVLLGTATVFLTYRLGRAVAPERPEIGLGAAAVNAFLPMFLFITGSVNNDNLAIMLTSLALLLLIGAVTRNPPAQAPGAESASTTFSSTGAGTWLLAGSVIGLALLTKEGTLGLLPLAWGTAFVAAWQRTEHGVGRTSNRTGVTGRLVRSLGQSLLYFILILIPVLLIAGWWYYRNLLLYGDWLGWNAFIAVLGERGHPASLAQLWGERRGFLMSYWGLFGGVNVPMPGWVYAILNAFLLVAIPGFTVYLLRLVHRWYTATRGTWQGAPGVIGNALGFIIWRFALVASLLLSAAVVVGLIRWATTTWSSQGRLVFTALSSLSVLLVTGLAGWLPPRVARPVVVTLAGFMLLLSALAPFLWIAPAYKPETYAAAHLEPQAAMDIDFGDEMRLRSVAIAGEAGAPADRVKPGDRLWVTLEWEALQAMDRDWSVFVHLVDPVLQRPIAQRDMYLGQGLLLTSWLQPEQRVRNTYHLRVPETALGPAQLELVAGLYDYSTGERLASSSSAGAALLGTVDLQPALDEVPNPLAVNFEDRLTLTGFEIAPRRVVAGETVELQLYWRPGPALDQNYTFFAQVVGEDTTRWAAFDGTADEPTSSWQAGEVRKLPVQLTLSPETPPGLYPVIIGLYTVTADGSFERLQVRAADDRLTDDYFVLAQVRVD